MMADFDVNDKNSWYVGKMTREEANTILLAEREAGVFIVRDSSSVGGYVLCVKEENKVSHYIIKPLNTDGAATRFVIGDHEFASLAELLTFYKTHYLDKTSLIRPAERQKYITKYRFAGKDADDLAFERGEILALVRKDEDQWWTLCNSSGQIGLVPVPYIEPYVPESRCVNSSNERIPPLPPVDSQFIPPVQRDRVLPCRALVVKNRIPSAYDRTQLKLKVGEEIVVTATPANGQWQGKLANGTHGIFPFTHVQFIDD